jgi:hypothetical protein
MEKAYYTYRIQVVSRERVRVTKLNSEQQVLANVPPSDLRYQEKLDPLTGLVKKAQGNSLNSPDKVRELGEILFDVLFDNALCQDFVNFYYEVVQGKKQFLRIELDIDEQILPDLAALPWEFMCLPARENQGEIWLATDPSLIFSRHSTRWQSPPNIQLGKDEKLKIAVVVAMPPDLNEFNYAPVQANLEALASEQAEYMELLPIVTQADRKSINAVLEQKPHIFHFIGHGQLEDEQGREVGQLALVDKSLEQAEWSDANQFSGLFAQHRPAIVVLQACEGGAISASEAFAGVASKIVQQNIPVVIAMQYLVPINIANQFVLSFYEQLAKGYPVDVAAQVGRNAIALGTSQYKKRNFATPVIFMQGDDGYLFQRAGVEAEPVTPETIRAFLAEADIEFDEAEDAEIIGNEFSEAPSGGEHRARIKGRLVRRGKIVGNQYRSL